MDQHPYTLLVVATLKGGVRKSTTVMFTAFGLAAKGEDVTVIDADLGTQGVTDWCTRFYAANPGGELPFHVFQWSSRSGLIARFIRDVMGQTGSRWCLVDVGGEDAAVLAQVALLADDVISPTGPEDAELGRLHATRTALRANGGPRMRVLLTRVPKIGAGIAAGARSMLTEQEDPYDVLGVEIPQDRDTYAHPWGAVPANLGRYAALTDQIITERNGRSPR